MAHEEAKKRSPRVAWVESRVRERYSTSRLLDVGFVGTYQEPFLHLAIRSQNPRAQIIGVDINVREMLKRRLSNVVGARAESLGFKENAFEVVLCLELLEHVYSPMNILLEFWRVLRPGGNLILTTPNAWSWWNFARHWMTGSLTSRSQRKVYRHYLGDADHKQFYDPLSLMNLLDDAGFEIVEAVTKNHAVPVLRRWSKSFDLLDWQFYPMNRIGHYLCLVAKKAHAPRVRNTEGPELRSAGEPKRAEL